MEKYIKEVELSSNSDMFRQIDGVAIGSPLGPVLANVFMGYCESQIPLEHWPSLYWRYMDDTCSLFSNEREAWLFLATLNDIQPSLKFTMEKEVDGVLPFFDVQVIRQGHSFEAAVYRKPAFTGLYIRWGSYAPNGQKLALIKSLTPFAKRICSKCYLSDEIRHLKLIFQRNGYPSQIVNHTISQPLNSSANNHIEPTV